VIAVRAKEEAMGRQYIRDENGEVQTDSEGRRQFWSDNDGDSKPETNQTTYSESNKIGVGNTKNDSTYNPSTGQWNKK
jgi:hypothetical protein